MGYYTAYSLEVRGKRIDPNIAANLASAIRADEYMSAIFDRDYYLSSDQKSISFYSNDVFKWYDHDTTLMMLSTKFPDLTFCLHGEGEENGDLWNTYYKNGKTEHCPGRIEYEEPQCIEWN